MAQTYHKPKRLGKIAYDRTADAEVLLLASRVRVERNGAVFRMPPPVAVKRRLGYCSSFGPAALFDGKIMLASYMNLQNEPKNDL